jgi:anti-sigma regulatory factor (Ser/Thr protein kinase)
MVEFFVRDSVPQIFVISVTDTGPGIENLAAILNGNYVSKTGLGKGIIGISRPMDHFQIVAPAEGTRVEAGKPLPMSST